MYIVFDDVTSTLCLINIPSLFIMHQNNVQHVMSTKYKIPFFLE